jgi:DNA-directed RNA polymerase specialized sigma24 family protein
MSIEPKNATSSLPVTDDSPNDLLTCIFAGEDGERNEAAKIIYQRYSRRLYGMLRKAISGCGDTFVEELVLETFHLAFTKADQFRHIDDEEREAQENRFMRWLVVISKRRFFTLLRKNPPSLFIKGDDAFWEQVNADMQTNSAPAPESKIVAAASDTLNELPERDADILRTIYMHRPDINNSQSKLPREVIAELCERYETTPENLRTIHFRALKRFQGILEQKGVKL